MKSKKTCWIVGISVMLILLSAALAPQEVKILLFTLIADF